MIDTAIIASLPDHPSAGQNMEFILVGFVFVILVLLILAGITQMVGLIFKSPPPPKAKSTVASTPAASTANTPAALATEGEELDPALTAVIVAAAVHAVIGDRPHRILNIRPTQPGWAQEGRRQIFSSHSVR